MARNRKNADCRYDNEHRRLYRGETVRGNGYEYKYYDVFRRRRSLYAKTLKELREKEKNVDRYRANGRQTLDQVMQDCFRLFFSESPVEEFSCNDEDAVVDKLAAARPALKKVRDTEIPLNAVDGKNIKIEEWAARMRLGIFAVPTVSDTNHLYNGVGIIRKE